MNPKGIGAFKYLLDGYKRHGSSFDLTEKQFKELTQKNCYYCGAKPNNVVNRKDRNGSFTYNGIDRVDNTKGYTIDNVVTCCRHCNTAKNSMTLEEFKCWIEKVYNRFNPTIG